MTPKRVSPKAATPRRVPLGVLDLVPIGSGAEPAAAVRNSIDLARVAEALGYARYWFAEHHLHPDWPRPRPCYRHGGAATAALRLGSGGLQGGHRTAFSIVEEFGLLDALVPGTDRPGDRAEPAAPGCPARARGRRPAGEGPIPTTARLPDRGGPADPDRPPVRGTRSPLVGMTADLVLQDGAAPARYGELLEDVLGLLEGPGGRPDGLAPRPVPGSGADLELWVIGRGEGRGHRGRPAGPALRRRLPLQPGHRTRGGGRLPGRLRPLRRARTPLPGGVRPRRGRPDDGTPTNWPRVTRCGSSACAAGRGRCPSPAPRRPATTAGPRTSGT